MKASERRSTHLLLCWFRWSRKANSVESPVKASTPTEVDVWLNLKVKPIWSQGLPAASEKPSRSNLHPKVQASFCWHGRAPTLRLQHLRCNPFHRIRTPCHAI